MHEAQSVAARGKGVALQNIGGQRIGRRRSQVFERGVNDAPDHARADAADGFVNGHDAADFGGIGRVVSQQLELRIYHFDAPGPQRIEIGFAVQHDALAGAKASVQIRAVKKFASAAGRWNRARRGDRCAPRPRVKRAMPASATGP